MHSFSACQFSTSAQMSRSNRSFRVSTDLTDTARRSIVTITLVLYYRKRTMSNFGFGYGSQWHLLRYLGYHRQRLNDTIREQVGGRAIEWLDFPFSEWIDPLWQDRELVGLEFIANHVHAALAWTKFWPQQGTFHNWDAIAKITYDSHEEWLLVEAKATVGEMRSSCRATNPVSLDTIQAAFDAARPSFGADAISSTAWLTPFYQYCNRLTMLHFLQQACQPIVRARMLFIYF